jgi:hypothetical protein
MSGTQEAEAPLPSDRSPSRVSTRNRQVSSPKDWRELWRE